MRKNKGWAVLVILEKLSRLKGFCFWEPSRWLNIQTCTIWSQDASTSRHGVGINMLMWVWGLQTSLRDVCAACHTRSGFGLQASLECCSRNMHVKRVSQPVSQRTEMLWRCSAQQGVIECSVFLCLRPAACVHRGGVTVSQSY